MVKAGGEHDLLRLARERVEAVLGHLGIDDDARGFHEVGAHRCPDRLVEGRPVKEARKDLAHRHPLRGPLPDGPVGYTPSQPAHAALRVRLEPDRRAAAVMPVGA